MDEDEAQGCLAAASAMQSCGCLLTVFVTLPILLFTCYALL